MPRVFCYCRVSTERQAAKGDSLDVQQANAKRAFQYEYEPKGFALADIIQDPAESGGKPLLNRPGGSRLHEVLQAGDVVVFPKLDRGFRSVEDMLKTVRLWKAKGVHVRMLDISVDTSTQVGEMILTVMAAVAQFERQRIGERLRAHWAHRRKLAQETGDKCIVTSVRPPYGFKVCRSGNRRRWVPDGAQRQLGRAIVDWRDQQGWSFHRIWSHLLKNRIYRLNSKGGKREWSLNGIRGVYVAERKLQLEERAEATTVGSATCTSAATK
jgi:DNA invertase Pin-like site-specific DNA recombinase